MTHEANAKTKAEAKTHKAEAKFEARIVKRHSINSFIIKFDKEIKLSQYLQLNYTTTVSSVRLF